jgi:hypothetical protein
MIVEFEKITRGRPEVPMSGDHLNIPPGANLDADAVCAACGTVNPEGTLICKVCGNNLRDQRLRRFQAEQILETDGEVVGGGRRWFTGVLTGVGALLVLVVALNVNSIADRVVAGSVGSAGVDAMWRGETAGTFDTLLDELRARTMPTDAEIETAMVPVALEDGAEPPAVDGFYLLMPANATSNAPPLGTALVRTEGGEIIFVAQLNMGAEVRGWGGQRSSAVLTAEAGRCAMLIDNVYMPVYGFAQREEPNSFTVWGQFQVSEEDLQGFTAYRLP